jgi:hypothetical protein
LRVSSTTTGRIVAGSAARAAKLGNKIARGYAFVAINIVLWRSVSSPGMSIHTLAAPLTKLVASHLIAHFGAFSINHRRR